MGFDGDFMGLNGDLMGFKGDFMGFDGIYWTYREHIRGNCMETQGHLWKFMGKYMGNIV